MQLWLSCTLFAQEQSVYSQLSDRSIAYIEGIPDPVSWSEKGICKDDIGRFLIATRNGLTIYDGYELKTQYVEGFDKHTIQSNSLSACIKDHKGDIWFATAYDGIFKYDKGKETYEKIKFDSLKDNGIDFLQVNGLMEDSDHNIWITPPFEAPYIYSPRTNELHQIDLGFDIAPYSCLELSDGLISISAHRLCLLGLMIMGFVNYKKEELISSLIFQAETPDKNIILYSGAGPGVFLFDRRKNIIRTITTEFNAVSYLHDENGLMYVFGDDNLYVMDTLSYEPLKILENVSHCKDAVFDQSGNILCVSQDKGLVRINLEGDRFAKVKDGFCEIVKRLDDETFTFIKESNKLVGYNTTTERSTLLVDLSEIVNKIHNYYIYPNGDIFINANYHNETRETNIFLNNEGALMNSLGQARIYYRLRAVDKKIGVVNELMGDFEDDFNIVYVKDIESEITGEKERDYLAITNFTVLENGELYMSNAVSGYSVVAPNRESVKQVTESKGEGSFVGNRCLYFYESSQGHIYIETDKGVAIYSPEQDAYRFLNRSNGLMDYNILRIGEDHDGNIWMLCHDALYSYNYTKEELLKVRLPSEYEIAEQYEKDLFVDLDGYIYLDFIDGLYKFLPEELLISTKSKEIFITDLYINRSRVFPIASDGILDSSIVFQNEFELNFNQRDVGFKFVVVDGQVDELQYFYKLNGYQDEYVKADINRTIHFTNLNNGEYVFEVKVKSKNGEWIDAVATKRFKIIAPWYKNNWAYGMYVFIICASFYFFYRIKINQLLKYQNLRTKISSDLHDDVGTLLSSAAMLSEVLGMNAKQEDQKMTNKLSAISREAMQRMRDTVWAIDSRKDSVESLLQRMKDFATSLSETGKLKLEFEENISKFQTNLQPDIRQNVYLIFKEAVINSFKHSNGDTLNVKVTKDRKSFQLIIQDNGVIDESKIKASGMGISNMKMRAKKINSTLEINYKDGFYLKLTI